ncbi:MAG: threonine/homoserine/homoserine lactone efflux protein [Verrucomicrobiales bacterium]|jgi:threonine/homoserine/homoserine lactone efflux protein
MQIVTFALTMAAGQLTPGPDMLLILKNTLNHDLRAGLATIAGICVGIILHVTLVFAGLAALLARSSGLFRAVQVLGACYLLYIAWNLVRHFRASNPVDITASTRPKLSQHQAFKEGFWTNLSNVKVMILFSSILAPLSTGPDSTAWIFGLIIIVEAALIWPLFAWLMQRPRIRTQFFRYQQSLNLIFALLIGGFAARLLLGL